MVPPAVLHSPYLIDVVHTVCVVLRAWLEGMRNTHISLNPVLARSPTRAIWKWLEIQRLHSRCRSAIFMQAYLRRTRPSCYVSFRMTAYFSQQTLDERILRTTLRTGSFLHPNLPHGLDISRECHQGPVTAF